MIKPTVGRIVWFHPGPSDLILCDRSQPLAATIAYVHSDRLVNLTVSDMNGSTHPRTSVQLIQDGDSQATPQSYCEWMPYQGPGRKDRAVRSRSTLAELRTMRRPQAIHYAKLESVEQVTDDKEAFEYRPELGWAWLQRLLFAALKRIGTYRQLRTTVWTRSVEENDELLSSLLAQENDLLSDILDGCKMRIYVGPDQHPRLLQQMHAMGMHPFAISGRIQIARGRMEPEMHDIPITCVPWIDGAIIVPA